MRYIESKIIATLLVVFILCVPVVGADGWSTTVTLDLTGGSVVPPTPSSSTLIVIADDAVREMGYTVNGVVNATSVPISLNGQDIEIIPSFLPEGTSLKSTFQYLGVEVSSVGSNFREHFPRHPEAIEFYVYLSLETGAAPPGADEGEGGSGTTPDTPSVPETPVVPDIPEIPDTPFFPEVPDTPGSDEPGSDEPYLPILPPADNVYNLAGFIPLGAGALLLFLVFFWRRKVYRILKSHAKKHGEKPEKEHLKEIADAIIRLVRDENRYPEWRKNSDVMKRLWFDIESVLDEMNYPKIVPRGALVAEIIKAARGRINRHRL